MEAKTLEQKIVDDLKICEAATAGPWIRNKNSSLVRDKKDKIDIAIMRSIASAEFIAAARTGWPKYITAFQMAIEELEKYGESHHVIRSIKKHLGLSEDD